MEVVVQKWGNSLGIRIPSIIAKEHNLKNGIKVEIFDDGEKISIKPQKGFTLDELVDGITSKNIHKSVETGDRMGNEEW
jgi:antitoxin MazE